MQVVLTIAVVCSSWISINAGTSKRTMLTPMGDDNVPSVRKSNKMVSRSQGILYII
jgi:hypothetical protein